MISGETNSVWIKALYVLWTLTGDSNGFLVSGVNEGFLAVVIIRFPDQVSLLLCLGWRLNLDLIAENKMFISRVMHTVLYSKTTNIVVQYYTNTASSVEAISCYENDHFGTSRRILFLLVSK